MAEVDTTVRTLDFSQSDVGIDEAMQLLESFSDAQLHYRQAIEDPSRACSDEELGRIRDHFSKLKFTFLELSTKRSFLAGLASLTDASFKVEQAILSLEPAVDAAKAGVKKEKSQNTALREAVASAAAAIAARDAAFRSSRDSLAARCARACDGATRVQAQSAAVGPFDPEASARTMDAQIASIRALNADCARLQDDAAQLRWEADPLLESVSRLSQDVAAQERALHALSAAAAGGGAKGASGEHPAPLSAEERVAAARAVCAAVASASGVAVGAVRGDSVRVSVPSAALEVDVEFHPGTAVLRAASVASPSPCPFHWGDVLDRAVATDSVPFLVRELRARCRAHAARAEELAGITGALRCTVRSDPLSGELSIALPSGAVAHFDRVAPHYEPGIGVELAVQRIDCLVQGGAQRVVDAVNEQGFDSVRAVVEFIATAM